MVGQTFCSRNIFFFKTCIPIYSFEVFFTQPTRHVIYFKKLGLLFTTWLSNNYNLFPFWKALQLHFVNETLLTSIFRMWNFFSFHKKKKNKQQPHPSKFSQRSVQPVSSHTWRTGCSGCSTSFYITSRLLPSLGACCFLNKNALTPSDASILW